LNKIDINFVEALNDNLSDPGSKSLKIEPIDCGLCPTDP